VNYAIADAVATANLLAGPLRAGTLTATDLRRVQRRRAPAVRMAQALQRAQTQNLVRLAGSANPPVRLIQGVSRFAIVRRLLGRLIGLGFRREHIRFEEVRAQAASPARPVEAEARRTS
jgi:hypothetical protein